MQLLTLLKTDVRSLNGLRDSDHAVFDFSFTIISFAILSPLVHIHFYILKLGFAAATPSSAI
jgi:hypothetical protein